MQPFEKARQLILSLSQPQDAEEKIKELSSLPPETRQKVLAKYYNTALPLASAGNTKAISMMLRVFDHFGDTSHDRMLLHYIAQAQTERTVKNMEKQTPADEKSITEALQFIAKAFTYADEINVQNGES